MSFPIVIPRNLDLLEGRLLRRYKRFFADVELTDGRVVTAHCVNTGTMEGLTKPGLRVWISPADNPNRKLKFTWELTEVNGEICGSNTALPNKLVHRLLLGRQLPWLASWDELKPEQKYAGNRRIDFWMKRGSRETLVEVKNCHVVYPDGRGYFPDTVSERASHHLRALAESAGPKSRAHVLFVVQFPAKAIRPSDVHDPTFAETAREVRRQGVTFSAIALQHTLTDIIVLGRIPVDLKPYRTERIVQWRKNSKAELEDAKRQSPPPSG
ncbi:DNA/RNA nuclease SfsA [bacterium]|nr:DNA/RNA nuclease SfsA [bacterium]